MVPRRFVIELDGREEGENACLYLRHVMWPNWQDRADYATAFEDQWALLRTRWTHPLFPSPETPAERRAAEFAGNRLADRLIAWEFIRRNPDYRLLWARWHRTRRVDHEESLAERGRLEREICDRFHIDTELELPPDPFVAGPAVFAGEVNALHRPVLPNDGEDDHEDAPYLGVRIYLDQPLGPQLAEIERLAAAHRPNSPTSAEPRRRLPNYITYLQLLDGREAGASRKDLARILFPGAGGLKRGEHAERAASQLMNGGYFRLIKRHFCLN